LRRYSARASRKRRKILRYQTFDKIAYPSLTSLNKIKLSIKGQAIMNHANWLSERLYQDRAAELQKEAQNERLAQEAQKEAPQNHSRNILAKFRAELSDLSMSADDNKQR